MPPLELCFGEKSCFLPKDTLNLIELSESSEEDEDELELEESE